MTIENTNTIDKIVSQQFSQISQLKQAKKEQTAPLYQQINNIECSFDKQICIIEEELESLKEQYSQLALELAIEKGQCPRSRWGGYADPDRVNVKQNGIELSWIYENSYGGDSYDYFEANWHDLVALENQKQEEEEEDFTEE